MGCPNKSRPTEARIRPYNGWGRWSIACGGASGSFCQAWEVNGEDFLRDLAAQIITESDVDLWWRRFSSAFGALDLVGAIDDAIAREVGEEIRAGLAEMSGEEVPRFHLASRRRPPAMTHPDQVDGIGDLSGLTARSAWSLLPPEMGSGGVNFVSQTDQQCWLVCSGAGPAPWPQHEPPRPPTRQLRRVCPVAVR
jgi:hypothetical protein